MIHPLRFDSGTKWIYGFGIDWAGILITRLNTSKCTLGEYFRKHILGPLEMKSTTFRPLRGSNTKERLASISTRGPDGTLKPGSIDVWLRDSEEMEMEPAGWPLLHTSRLPQNSPRTPTFLFSIVEDTSPSLLTEDMIKEMFRPQVSSAAWLTENTVDPRGITISENALFPTSPVNQALGFIVHDSDLETGAKKGTAEGAGMTNTFWWLDRESGVAGLCFLNLLPYMDVQAVVALAKECIKRRFINRLQLRSRESSDRHGHIDALNTAIEDCPQVHY